MEPWVISTGLILLYILVTLVLGYVANRRLAIDLDDFFLYGRKAGFGVLFLTVVNPAKKSDRLGGLAQCLSSRHG